ncbi:MAG: DMT family transporter [Rhizobiales bacterium]|nr:DMT family transporter [Hyphomicrobiales bacterium]
MHPVLLGTVAALSWGTLDFLAGLSSRRLGYVQTTAGVTLSGFLLLTLALAAFGPFPRFETPTIWLAMAAGGGIALATMFLFAALASGPISLAIPVAMSYPASTVVVFAAIGIYPSLPQLLAVLAILGGAGLVAMTEPAESQGAAPGRIRRTIAFALLAHVIFLLSVLAGQNAAEEIGALQSAWVSRIGGSILMLPILFFGSDFKQLSFRAVPLLAAMGLLDILGMSALFAAGRTEQPELATVCSAAAGAITVILAAVFLKERVKLRRWVGIILVFSGVSALSLAK